MVWVTDERCLALFTAGAIVRDPHHCESPTCREQDLNLRRTEFGLSWIKLCSSDNHYTTVITKHTVLLRLNTFFESKLLPNYYQLQIITNYYQVITNIVVCSGNLAPALFDCFEVIPNNNLFYLRSWHYIGIVLCKVFAIYG